MRSVVLSRRSAATVDVALVYVDASALVKLVREEQHTPALSQFLDAADVLACELVLAEVPRAVRRAAADDPELPLAALLERSERVIAGLALLPLDPEILLDAGAFEEPGLRALDAIHVASALHAAPIDRFVTYDERQAAAARLAGLRTVAPGA
jgi:uncharacterized protein